MAIFMSNYGLNTTNRREENRLEATKSSAHIDSIGWNERREIDSPINFIKNLSPDSIDRVKAAYSIEENVRLEKGKNKKYTVIL